MINSDSSNNSLQNNNQSIYRKSVLRNIVQAEIFWVITTTLILAKKAFVSETTPAQNIGTSLVELLKNNLFNIFF